MEEEAVNLVAQLEGDELLAREFAAAEEAAEAKRKAEEAAGEAAARKLIQREARRAEIVTTPATTPARSLALVSELKNEDGTITRLTPPTPEVARRLSTPIVIEIDSDSDNKHPKPAVKSELKPIGKTESVVKNKVGCGCGNMFECESASCKAWAASFWRLVHDRRSPPGRSDEQRHDSKKRKHVAEAGAAAVGGQQHKEKDGHKHKKEQPAAAVVAKGAAVIEQPDKTPKLKRKAPSSKGGDDDAAKQLKVASTPPPAPPPPPAAAAIVKAAPRTRGRPPKYDFKGSDFLHIAKVMGPPNYTSPTVALQTLHRRHLLLDIVSPDTLRQAWKTLRTGPTSPIHNEQRANKLGCDLGGGEEK